MLIAGPFHSMRNAMVNPTGLGVTVWRPQTDILVIISALAILSGVILAIAPPAV